MNSLADIALTSLPVQGVWKDIPSTLAWRAKALNNLSPWRGTCLFFSALLFSSAGWGTEVEADGNGSLVMKGALPSSVFAWPCLNKDITSFYFTKAQAGTGNLPMTINSAFIQQIFTRPLSGLKTP